MVYVLAFAVVIILNLYASFITFRMVEHVASVLLGSAAVFLLLKVAEILTVG